MASTRIYRDLKIDCCAFNMESTNSKITVLLARLSNGDGDEQYSQALCRHRGDDVGDFHECVVIFRHDERVKPNRDAGFAAERGSLIKSANSRQADCESVSIASRTGLDQMGGGSGVSRIPTGRMDFRDGDRIAEERAFSSFRGVRQLVASPERRSSTIHRSWLLHRASQSDRRSHSFRLQKRSNSRLCLRLQ